MYSIRSFIGFALGAVAAVAANAQIISVALEDRHVQTGADSTALTGFHFYATVEQVEGVTSATVHASSGALTTPTALDVEDDFLEIEETRGTLGSAIADFPLSASYTIAASGPTSGSVTINGPGGFFSQLVPDRPVFTIDGVSGTWSNGVFSFDPTGVTSFTVTINNYGTSTPGGHYAYYLMAEGMGVSGEVDDGPLTDDTPFSPPTFTFTNGLAADGDDDEDNTFGFTAGSNFFMEAGFFNIIGLTASGLGEAQQAFVAGSTTYFSLQAIPEPSTYAAIFGALALVGVAIHRRRRAV